MPSEVPCSGYMALYIISMHIINTNSRTSTHWKLDVGSGKVQAAVAAGGEGLEGDSVEDPLLAILTNKVSTENGEWRLEPEPVCTEECSKKKKSDVTADKTGYDPLLICTKMWWAFVCFCYVVDIHKIPKQPTAGMCELTRLIVWPFKI